MTEPHLICTVAIELSRARWVIGALLPRGTKVTVGAVPGGDTERLMELLNTTRVNCSLAETYLLSPSGIRVTPDACASSAV